MVIQTHMKQGFGSEILRNTLEEARAQASFSILRQDTSIHTKSKWEDFDFREPLTANVWVRNELKRKGKVLIGWWMICLRRIQGLDNHRRMTQICS